MTQTDTNPRDWGALKRLAEAAIEADKTHSGLFEPGVWHVVEYGDEQSPGICVHSGDAWRVCFMATIQNQKDFDQQMAKAQHIATFNPATVLELIAEVERLKEINFELQSEESVSQLCFDKVVKDRDALKSQRDEMAEALGRADRHMVAAIEAVEFSDDPAATAILSQGLEALRRARSSLNKTGGKTDGAG